MGKSLVEGEMLDQARAIEATAKDKGCTILLPVDALVAEKFRRRPRPPKPFRSMRCPTTG